MIHTNFLLVQLPFYLKIFGRLNNTSYLYVMGQYNQQTRFSKKALERDYSLDKHAVAHKQDRLAKANVKQLFDTVYVRGNHYGNKLITIIYTEPRYVKWLINTSKIKISETAKGHLDKAFKNNSAINRAIISAINNNIQQL